MFFKERNSYVLRKKIEILLDNKELRETLGNNARNTIEVQHSWNRTVDDIKDILNIY